MEEEQITSFPITDFWKNGFAGPFELNPALKFEGTADCWDLTVWIALCDMTA